MAPLPKFPKFKRARAVQHIPIGTRLLTLGVDLRTELSAGPIMATPAERAVFGWLLRFGVPFEFQQPLMGGRAVPGGAVVDFIIYLEYPPIVLRVMSYWHTQEAQRQLDKLQKDVLEQEGFRVEDIWEWETLDWLTMSRTLENLLFGYNPLFATPVQVSVDETVSN